MDILEATENLPVWEPHPRNRPQCLAYKTQAQIKLYGGGPHGGKTELICGSARIKHRNSLLLRQTYPELDSGMVARALEFYGNSKYYNDTKRLWRLPTGQRIRFGYGEKQKDFRNYKGPNWDLIGIDEASELPRFEDGTTPIDMLLPWNRTTIPGLDVEMILGTNPGGPGEEWIMEWFAPWLDPMYYGEPAEDGEILHVHRNDKFNLVFTKEPVHDENTGEILTKTITFIESDWRDNPYTPEGYESNLRLLPEAMQESLYHKRWGVGAGDDIWQVIPSAWVRAAQARWQDRGRNDWEAGGLDVAYGGTDKTVLYLRSGGWFTQPRRWDGRDTPDGRSAARRVWPLVKHRRFPLMVDTFGYGADAYGELKSMGCDWAKAHFGNEKTERKEQNGRLGFANTRSEAVWRLREALDPEHGADLELPPDRRIFVDLTSYKWKQHAKGIQVESKADIIKRIGRSPDDGDAIVMCWYAGYSSVAKTIRNLTEGAREDVKRKYDVKY